MKESYISIQPEYVKQFHCDGTLCNAMCCKNWRISIDHNTYKKYQQLTDKVNRKRILSSIEFDKKTQNHEIQLTKNKTCPLLCEDNLCFIQKNLGENYLSNTCAEYPRHTREINGFLEKSLSMTCPVASQLALLNPLPMKFEKIDFTATRQNSYLQIDKTILPLFDYFIDLQMFIISLLQNRNFSLEERLIILGFFLDRTDELVLNNQAEQIPHLIDTYLSSLTTQDFHKMIDSIAPMPTQKIKFNFDLLEHLYHTASSEELFIYIDDITKAFHLEHQNDIQILMDIYEKNRNLYYNPFMEKYHYIFENYLVNQIFQNLFPFTLKGTLTHNYIIFITLFSITNFFTLGMSAIHEKALTPTHITQLLAFLTKLNSSQAYIASLENHLAKKEPDLLYFISTILK